MGGVLGTNGWDTRERGAAVAAFGLDPAEFERRHHAAVEPWETGATTLDEYLTDTVFYTERPFTRAAFRAFMFAQSTPAPAMIAVAREVATAGEVRLMTLNNESAELHEYRVGAFGLAPIFEAFLTSCYLGARKPDARTYVRAFGIAHADPERTVFIDDRPQNLDPARRLGVRTIHATDVRAVRTGLAALGVAMAPSPSHTD